IVPWHPQLSLITVREQTNQSISALHLLQPITDLPQWSVCQTSRVGLSLEKPNKQTNKQTNMEDKCQDDGITGLLAPARIYPHIYPHIYTHIYIYTRTHIHCWDVYKFCIVFFSLDCG